jgi:L-alanine-DL-glutamate epimerase-like enolase superfamily enzyme
MRMLVVRRESWPLRDVFAISRGARTAAEVVVVEVRDGPHVGRGECVPYPRYGESVDGVMAQISALDDAVAKGLDRRVLADRLPPGAARNAIDCAIWDLEAKRAGVPAWKLAGVSAPRPVVTAFTISLGTPDTMGAKAAEARHHPLLKIKLGGGDDLARVAAVREHAPNSRLIVDANEAWSATELPEFLPAMARLGVELVEQPLPAGQDAAVAEISHDVPLCADESCHTSDDVPGLVGRYDLVNIKLDKAGGLTEALRLAETARRHGLGIMVGTMLGTSLLMAPAMLIAPAARYVDLDGPLWMANDRPHGLAWRDGLLHPPDPALWG